MVGKSQSKVNYNLLLSLFAWIIDTFLDKLRDLPSPHSTSNQAAN